MALTVVELETWITAIKGAGTSPEGIAYFPQPPTLKWLDTGCIVINGLTEKNLENRLTNGLPG